MCATHHQCTETLRQETAQRLSLETKLHHLQHELAIARADVLDARRDTERESTLKEQAQKDAQREIDARAQTHKEVDIYQGRMQEIQHVLVTQRASVAEWVSKSNAADQHIERLAKVLEQCHGQVRAASACRLVGPLLRETMHERSSWATLFVNLVDVTSEDITATMQLQSTNGLMVCETPISVSACGTGQFRLSVDSFPAPNLAYSIAVLYVALYGYHVPGSPVRIPLPLWSIIPSGAGLQHCIERVPAFVQLFVTDGQGMPAPLALDSVNATIACVAEATPVSASVSTPCASLSVVVQAHESQAGAYRVTYTVPSPGQYLLSIHVGGTPLAGSPFSITASRTPNLEWMEISDSYRGFRIIPGTRLALAVSRSPVWDEHKVYDVPPGYRWATTAEVLTEAPHSLDGGDAYFNKGGWEGCRWQGVERLAFVCVDSKNTGKVHAVRSSLREYPMNRGVSYAREAFAGVLCYRIDADPVSVLDPSAQVPCRIPPAR